MLSTEKPVVNTSRSVVLCEQKTKNTLFLRVILTIYSVKQ